MRNPSARGGSFMTRLQLNRLSVHRAKWVMYDETFNSGVNIIHGDNGSGKSTIMDFVYYALGGDLREWRKEASLADHVVAELECGDAIVTVRREIEQGSAKPMHIYFGGYGEAQRASASSWQKFGYRRGDSEFSFSQVLFKAMGIPEVISDGESNVTMHQMLRVIYSDQLTPIQRIFRVERFDTWQIREAVGNVICGIGGYELYGLRIELRALEKRFKQVADELKSLLVVASAFEGVLPEHASAALAQSIARRADLQQELTKLLEGDTEQSSDQKVDATQERRIRRNVSAARSIVEKLSEEIDLVEYEMRDAETFIDHLRLTLEDFDDASATYNSLGLVSFEFCPCCFSELSSDVSPDECHLCGSEKTRAYDSSKTLAVRLDLEMQIRESRSLQTDREERLVGLKVGVKTAKAALRQAQGEAQTVLSGSMNRFEASVSDLSRKVGFLDSEIVQLTKRQTIFLEIQRLSEEKANINSLITGAVDRIRVLEHAQRSRAMTVARVVEGNMKYLLSMDLEQHSDFGEVDSFAFDFASDLMALNGDPDRVGSASGMVVLKNSFLLALFMASLEDKSFNLPRFMLMDNIEDKGMVQERSWNFQRLIVAASKTSILSNQIIFTTSKIAPELEGSALVVGRKYTKASPTLAIS